MPERKGTKESARPKRNKRSAIKRYFKKIVIASNLLQSADRLCGLAHVLACHAVLPGGRLHRLDPGRVLAEVGAYHKGGHKHRHDPARVAPGQVSGVGEGERLEKHDERRGADDDLDAGDRGDAPLDGLDDGAGRRHREAHGEDADDAHCGLEDELGGAERAAEEVRVVHVVEAVEVLEHGAEGARGALHDVVQDAECAKDGDGPAPRGGGGRGAGLELQRLEVERDDGCRVAAGVPDDAEDEDGVGVEVEDFGDGEEAEEHEETEPGDVREYDGRGGAEGARVGDREHVEQEDPEELLGAKVLPHRD
ncbi:hypothetical protein DFJ73DRAFT_207397 [Zopfochytrium polystomum]|nr:hypothetical protein DFJ73DRAFT_207397 [Zopfochytrium polystomum]